MSHENTKNSSNSDSEFQDVEVHPAADVSVSESDGFGLSQIDPEPDGIDDDVLEEYSAEIKYKDNLVSEATEKFK